MQSESPAYLSCMWCPSQAYITKSQPKLDMTLYICTAGHRSYIESEDTSFDYGYNYDKEEQ
jgi:hypothetical protein